ncbi:MAG: hypothetical protein COA86_13725 [Kangiella sp.]|nr:MAG: hypothetical protein COA86_13725 [Kangiella sp.]
MLSFFSHIKLTISKIFDSIKLFKLLLGTLFLTSILPTNIIALESNNLNGTTLNLLGIAIHSELRNEIYIGAMFAPAEVDNYKSLYDTSITKNMSLRFIQGYSKRKIARLWKQRIAMNNEKSKWQPLTKDIIRFAKIFKRTMQAGDEIKLIYIPSEGTKIYLNTSLFLVIKNPEFYTILLNTWYGKVPPSKLFKTGIIGENTDYLQQKIITQYESLISVPGRFDKDRPKTVSSKRVNTAINKKAPVIKETVNKTSNKNIVIAKSVSSATKSLIEGFKTQLPKIVTRKEKISYVADKKALFKINLELSDSNLDNTTLKPIDLSEPLSKHPITKTNKIPSKSPPQPQVTKETIDNTSKSNTKNTRVALAKTIEVEDFANNLENSSESDEVIDNDLIRGAYTRELINTVKKNQKYPKKAIQKGHEGNLLISLTVNAIGEIVNLALIQRSGSRYLDIGVLRQVREIEPFPPIPGSLNIESFEVEIPMNFSFTK